MNKSSQAPKIYYWEFIILNGLLFAQNVMALDTFLPVMSLLQIDFDLSNITDTQAFFTWLFLGFSISQFVLAPLSDNLGRKSVLVGSAVLMLFGGIAVMFATSFTFLLIARFVQGLGMGAGRTVNLSAMRDLYDGRILGKAVAHVYFVFGFVPIIAPWIGYFLFDYGWRYAAAAPVIYSAMIVCWLALRYPETLPKEKRTPFSFAALFADYKIVLKNKLTLFYAIACGWVFASIMLTLITASQIGMDVYGITWFGSLVFSAIAVSISVVSLMNARLIDSYGMRGVSHCALLMSLAAAIIMLILVLSVDISKWLLFFMLLCVIAPQAALMTNFQAIAMVPHQAKAGVAAAITGGVTTLLATVIASWFGRFYDGTALILAIGCVVSLVAALAIVLILWRGQLFSYDEKLKDGA